MPSSTASSARYDVRILDASDWAATVGAAWAGLLGRRPVSWEQASVLLLDEFGDLAPGEPGGCDATLRRALVDRVDLAPGGYRSIDTAAGDLDAECRAVDAWLDGGLGLAVLGLGGNGHLGMNEPGSPVTARTRRVELAAATVEAAASYFGDRRPLSWGVTVGLADLVAAERVWVLVTGFSKADTVRACLEEPPAASRPASALQGHPRCTWWLDEAAASRLTAQTT